MFVLAVWIRARWDFSFQPVTQPNCESLDSSDEIFLFLFDSMFEKLISCFICRGVWVVGGGDGEPIKQ